jgi:hypothetical protein
VEKRQTPTVECVCCRLYRVDAGHDMSVSFGGEATAKLHDDNDDGTEKP